MRFLENIKDAALERLASATARRIGSDLEPRPGKRADLDAPVRSLRERVARLEREVQECRRLNQRLSDVVDVVTEILVPVADRDDSRMRAALGRLDEQLDGGRQRRL